MFSSNELLAMTCVTCCGSAVTAAQTCNMSATSVKLNHRRFRALLKKFRRKRIRQNAAKERDQLMKGEPQEEEEEEEPSQEEQERQRRWQHEQWLEREAEAQRQFARRRLREEPPAEPAAEELSTKQGSLQQVLAQLPQAPSSAGHGGSWHNPPAPGSYQPPEPCPFFLKTGACRFADSCSRAHPVPPASRTLLLRGLYGHVSLERLPGGGGDEALETDEGELRAHFEHFFWDLLGELRRAGTVRQLRVCRNLEPHLRGNVYVQYHSVEEAQRARTLLNGRWYAGRPVSCEFSPVERLKMAVCGLFFRGACPKGRSCNFLHVFRNPQDECWHDEGRSPAPSRRLPSPPKETGRKRRRRSSSRKRRRHRSRSSSRGRSSRKSASRRRSTSRHR